VAEDAEGSGKDGGAPLSGRRLGAAALLLAASVAASRGLGFVREMVLAARVGIGSSTDAYYAAFQIPDLLNYLLAGGALAIAFTPLYLRTLENAGERAADELFRTVLGTLGALACVLTAALWIYAERLVDLQFSGFDAQTRAETVRLTRIVLPGQIFFIAGGIVRAVLMAHGRFAAQAAAPIVYNGAIIAGGLLMGTVEGFAWGALAGAVLGNWAFPVYDARKLGGVGFRVAPWDPRFHVYLWGALPLMLGLSLTTVDEWYERIFGASLGVGVVAALAFARRLMMAPVAVIGQAVATAALPSLASLHAQGRSPDLDARLLSTLRVTLLLALWAASAFYVFATPIVELVYQRGEFGSDDTLRVSALLSLMGLAVPGWVIQQVAVRGFFARGEMWRPMGLGTLIALGAIPLYMALAKGYGAEGLVLAGVLAISLNALCTLAWARVRYGGPHLRPLLSTGVRAFAAAGIAGWASSGALTVLGGGHVQALLLGGAVFTVVVGVASWGLGDRAMRDALGLGIARLGAGLRRSRSRRGD
jgi:putative peptidoglycan lipid II flippase